MKYRRPSLRKISARLCSALELHRLVQEKSAIRIVVYHRVMDELCLAGFPFDRELVDATVGEFDREIKYLSENYDIVSFADVTAHLDRGVPLPARPLLITLDDGFQDNYLHALPVLKKYTVPATLFLATGYIGSRDTFWYDRLAFILMNTGRDMLELGAGGKRYSLADTRKARMQVFTQVMRELGRAKNRDRLSILDHIFSNYGDVYDLLDDDVRALSLPLNWEQVNEMKNAGINIGSHSVSHPFLSQVNRETLYSELRQSSETIEQMTGVSASVLAYPNGQRCDFTEQVKQAARETGYSLGLSFIDGVNRLPIDDRFEFRRLHISPRHNFSIFRMALSWPGLF